MKEEMKMFEQWQEEWKKATRPGQKKALLYIMSMWRGEFKFGDDKWRNFVYGSKQLEEKT